MQNEKENESEKKNENTNKTKKNQILTTNIHLTSRKSSSR